MIDLHTLQADGSADQTEVHLLGEKQNPFS